MVCEGIKPDIFDINRDLPTGRPSPSLPRLEHVDSGLVRTPPLLPCPYYISNRPKTRSQESQRNVLAYFFSP